jgi:hypothetical protein
MAISVGPASASMPTTPRSSRLAAVTQMLPGPVIMSTGSQCSAPSGSTVEPYASIATAWAPPTAYTSSTPSSAQAASTRWSGRPPFSRCGGLTTTRERTPAAWAGTTFITTVDGYIARPPGT